MADNVNMPGGHDVQDSFDMDNMDMDDMFDDDMLGGIPAKQFDSDPESPNGSPMMGQIELSDINQLRMEQDKDGYDGAKWRKGQHCDIFCRLQKKWVDGQVIDVFKDEEGQRLKVKYGRTITEIQPDDPDVRAKNTDIQSVFDLNWYHILHCIGQEMYPMMLRSMSSALSELMGASAVKFEIDNFSKESVQKVIQTLKTKKVLLSNEIKYIEGVVERARAFKWEQTGGINSCHFVHILSLSDSVGFCIDSLLFII